MIRLYKRLSRFIYIKKVSKARDLHDIDDTLFFGNSSTTNRCALAFKEIAWVQSMVDQAVLKSFGFGLKIDREHVIKEKMTLLCLLNSAGRLIDIPKNYEFHEIMGIFSEAISEEMENEMTLYHQRLGGKKNAVRNMYACHLEDIRTNILREIYK